ncbi:hypothetical protein GGR56DRAFT_356637 [Xylariaceae sp. FL0804]|nr:hypothetical protein GGR56DRAFT_356637 [Xylariaceae sp. FL0804]
MNLADMVVGEKGSEGPRDGDREVLPTYAMRSATPPRSPYKRWPGVVLGARVTCGGPRICRPSSSPPWSHALRTQSPTAASGILRGFFPDSENPGSGPTHHTHNPVDRGQTGHKERGAAGISPEGAHESPAPLGEDRAQLVQTRRQRAADVLDIRPGVLLGTELAAGGGCLPGAVSAGSPLVALAQAGRGPPACTPWWRFRGMCGRR